MSTTQAELDRRGVRACIEFAGLLHVPLQVGVHAVGGEVFGAPGGGSAIFCGPDGLRVLVEEGARDELWTVLLHEISHVAWWHPGKGMGAILCEGPMIAYEFQVVRALGGLELARNYLNDQYTQFTALGEESHPQAEYRGIVRAYSEVADWRHPRRSSWWRRGLDLSRRLGLLDDHLAPTWQRAAWSDAEGRPVEWAP